MGKSLVLGFFDGIHKGHKAVIESALNYSDEVVLITFKDSPSIYFGKEKEYILSRENSVLKAEAMGVKKVNEVDFGKIINQSAEDYLENLINIYHPISISTGFNHTFGHNKKGTPELLETNQKKYNYKYFCIPPVRENNTIISSTLIKNYLREGKITDANSLLDSNFILEGTVIHGQKLGRTIGYPTANIDYPDGIVKIPYGVYSVTCKIPQDNKTYHGIMNWGMKPTFNNTKKPVAEIHLLNYDGDLYGKKLRAEVTKLIRKERKFNSPEELKNQICEDIKNA